MSAFEDWWCELGKQKMPDRERYRVLCKMAFEAGAKTRIDGQTIEQWRERALILGKQIEDMMG